MNQRKGGKRGQRKTSLQNMQPVKIKTINNGII